MKNRLSILAAISVVIALVVRSPLLQADIITVLVALLLGFLCFAPSIIWIWRGMGWVPLFELYALVHLAYYWNASITANSVLWQVPETLRCPILAAVCIYLLSGSSIYYLLLRRAKRRQQSRRSFWSRTIEPTRTAPLFWSALAVWALYQAASMLGWLPDFGRWAGTIRAIASAGGTIAIFYFSARLGARQLSAVSILSFLGFFATGLFFAFANGFLGVGAFILCTALFGYAVQAKQVPIFATIGCIVFVAYLNLGKAEMRQIFWEEGSQGVMAGSNPIEVYSYWVNASWRKMTQGGVDEDDESDLSRRADLLRMLGLVMVTTPDEQPFMNGQSYRESLPLFVPGFLWPGRPSIHDPQKKIGLHYSVLSEETVDVTSISFGQVAEGWLNFGWIGLALAGAFSGLFFGWGTSVAYGRSMNSIAFFFGLLFSGWAVNVEHLWGAMLMSFYQSALISMVGLYFLSRPEPASEEPLAHKEKSAPVLT
jgi:hypothetical protein